jgi:hypothetical protein
MRSFGVFIAAILVAALMPASECKQRPDVNVKMGADADVGVQGSVRVVAVGKSPQFKIFPNANSTSFIQLK